MSTSSTNIRESGDWAIAISRSDRPTRISSYHKLDCHYVALTSLDWKNADHSTVGAVVFEAHSTGNFRKDGVILAEAGVPSRTEPTPTLPDDDGPSGDDVAVVCLDAEPL
jgi:hypothetical protein